MRIFSVLLMIGILLASVGCERAVLPRGTMELLRAVPSNVDLLAVAHVGKLKKSFLYELWKEREEEDRVRRDLGKFREEIGIDPERDVEIAVFSAAGGFKPPVFAALLIRGTFDREKIEDRLTEEGFKNDEYEGHRVYALPLVESPAMAFLDDHTFVLGTAGSVRTTVDMRRGEGESFAEAPDRMALVEGLTYRDQLWCLAEVNDASRKIAGEVLGSVQKEFDLSNIVDAVRQIALCADVRASLNVSLQGICDEEKDAELLARALRGLMAFGKMGAEEHGELIKLMDAIRIRSDKRTVDIMASVSRETLEHLEERMK